MRRGIAAKQELQAICENMMDNCLASNSETGGVGCDNMTITIVALLQGKTKEEWYKMVGDRVANGDGPCAPPEYGKSKSLHTFPAHRTEASVCALGHTSSRSCFATVISVHLLTVLQPSLGDPAGITASRTPRTSTRWTWISAPAC